MSESESPSGIESPSESEYVPYEDWGRDFFDIAVTGERVAGAMRNIVGKAIEFGPMGVGPGRIAKVSATGEVGEPTAVRLETALVAVRLDIPVKLHFSLDLQVDNQKFDADLVVPVILTARALTGLRIWIEATPPTPKDIQLTLASSSLRASMVEKLADIPGELRRFVAKYVTRELEKPALKDARMIDVASTISKVY